MKRALALFSFLILTNSCAALKPKLEAAKKVLVDCSKAELVANAIKLIPSVNSALQQDDYKSALDSLVNPAEGMGLDVLACVLQAGIHFYGDNLVANPSDEMSMKSLTRARGYIVDKGVIFITPSVPAPQTEAPHFDPPLTNVGN